MSLKNPVTPPGIDSGTFRLVAQRLNHYATPAPYKCTCKWYKINIKIAPTCFGVLAPSSGRLQFMPVKVMNY